MRLSWEIKINPVRLNANPFKGTNTWLNLDIEKTKHISIDNKTREELGNLSVIFWQDYFFVKNNEVDASFIEENKYRNYYEGYTNLNLPYYDVFDNINLLVKYWYTSKSSGTLKTPGYGEEFNENKFEYTAYYVYWIFLPTSLPNMIDIYPNLTFVLHFLMDVDLFPGIERVWLYNLWRSGAKEEVEEEFLYQTGNISIFRKYNASKFPQGEYTYIE